MAANLGFADALVVNNLSRHPHVKSMENLPEVVFPKQHSQLKS
jgi:hypothetical protein